MSHSQINALITLIEDPDPEIFSHIRTELTKKGETIIPHLERYWELNAYGDLFQDRVSNSSTPSSTRPSKATLDLERG